MYDFMRFWLDRGIDGFRSNVLWLLLKDEQYRDNPFNPDWKPGDCSKLRQIPLYTEDQPGIHEIVREMRSTLDAYCDRVLIGEIYLLVECLVHCYGEALNEAHLPFNFQLLALPRWEASVLRRVIDTYEGLLPQEAWPNWVLSNLALQIFQLRAPRARCESGFRANGEAASSSSLNADDPQARENAEQGPV